jgi:hypothetical protein
MLGLIKKLFGAKEAAPAPAVEAPAPYKVETPAVETAPVVEIKPEPAKCGCGRSVSGLCVGLHNLSEDEWAKHPDNKTAPTPVEPVPAAKPAKKPMAKKPAAPKKEAAPKAAPTKSTGTRKPKAKPAA